MACHPLKEERVLGSETFDLGFIETVRIGDDSVRSSGVKPFQSSLTCLKIHELLSRESGRHAHVEQSNLQGGSPKLKLKTTLSPVDWFAATECSNQPGKMIRRLSSTGNTALSAV